VAWLGLALLAAGLGRPWNLLAQAPAQTTGVQFAQIAESDMREWLGYLASDELQGRQVFTEGYGLAAAYVADRLQESGVKPLGDNGTYFQTVKRRGYRVTNNSAVTVTVNGQSRTFKHGDHVTFPAAAGGPQTLSFSGVEFVGYGMVDLGRSYDDFRNRDVAGKLVLWMPGTPEALSTGGRGGRGGANRNNFILQTYNAGAVLRFTPAPAPPAAEIVAAQAELEKANAAVAAAQASLQAARASAAGGRGGGRGGGGRGGRGGAAAPAADLTTVRNVDLLSSPQIAGDETFFEFLFSGGPMTFEAVRARAEAGEPLTPTSLANVQVAVTIDNTYDVLTTELSKNVVGLIEGSDPALRDTYVLFGAHLDHVGYRPAPGGRGGRGAPPAPGVEPDLIYNGADDDGSGSTALLGIAKAFATGPKPRRSVVIVWHTAEEAGLLGSQYMADHPVVPIDRTQAQFNIDMIGRNRDDNEAMSNTVFVIGADRISTDLHNIVVDTNATLATPLTLDYEYNDPSDTNSFYTRSDHYSYAAKGIPIAFFFTGTHPDYHGAGDHADKILYPKLTRITQLVYQAGFSVADSQRTLERDNRGPRAGRGFQGRIIK
jgi:hypothetical protein